MDKKKKHTTAAAASPEKNSNKLALVKAAAWAWHQHSSSSSSSHYNQSPPAAFPVAAPRRLSSRRPSRYLVEFHSKSSPTPPPAPLLSERTVPITLLDLYEIERITRELERLVAASERRDKAQAKAFVRKSKGGGGFFGTHVLTICGPGCKAVEVTGLVGRQRARERLTEVL